MQLSNTEYFKVSTGCVNYCFVYCLLFQLQYLHKPTTYSEKNCLDYRGENLKKCRFCKVEATSMFRCFFKLSFNESCINILLRHAQKHQRIMKIKLIKAKFVLAPQPSDQKPKKHRLQRDVEQNDSLKQLTVYLLYKPIVFNFLRSEQWFRIMAITCKKQ